jgi:hypothetical protein
MVIQFVFYHLLPLFDLALPSARSSCTLSSTPSTVCLHASDKEQIEKEELIQKSFHCCPLLVPHLVNTIDAGVIIIEFVELYISTSDSCWHHEQANQY